MTPKLNLKDLFEYIEFEVVKFFEAIVHFFPNLTQLNLDVSEYEDYYCEFENVDITIFDYVPKRCIRCEHDVYYDNFK